MPDGSSPPNSQPLMLQGEDGSARPPAANQRSWRPHAALSIGTSGRNYGISGAAWSRTQVSARELPARRLVVTESGYTLSDKKGNVVERIKFPRTSQEVIS